jgi:hypothetical protein
VLERARLRDMAAAPPRSFQLRKADALAILSAPRADAWVATASGAGAAHLVPLSIGWDGERVVLVTPSASTTAGNLSSSALARLALGGTRDVVMIDAEVVGSHPLAGAPPAALAVFAEQSGWNPADEPDADAYQLFVLRPVRLQAWREANEIAGRTLLRDATWIDQAT